MRSRWEGGEWERGVHTPRTLTRQKPLKRQSGVGGWAGGWEGGWVIRYNLNAEKAEAIGEAVMGKCWAGSGRARVVT